MGTTYSMDLYSNPHLKIRWLIPIIRKVALGASIKAMEPIPINGYGCTLYITPEISIDGDGIITLSLKWDEEGEKGSQDIRIHQEESNLVSGSYVYYFICPHGYKCKTLFYIVGRWRSRRTFCHRYANQNSSRRQREAAIFHLREPYRKYGKQRYRDRLTPYGKRCKRFEEKYRQGYFAMAEVVLALNKKKNKKYYSK